MTKSQKSSRKRMGGRAAGKWAFKTRIVKQAGFKAYREILSGAFAKLANPTKEVGDA